MSRYGTELLNLWNDQVEHCGFILDAGEIVEVANGHTNPKEGFCLPEREVEKYRARIVATWHTHPSTCANLSVPDYFLFCRLPQWEHVIIAQYSFRIYRAIGGRVLICEND